MAQHAGEFDTARMLWFTTYQSTKEGQIRQNAVEHLRALQVDEDVTRLEQLVAKYREQTGQLPASMGDLERAGFIHGTPVDPNGHPYKLMRGRPNRSAGSRRIFTSSPRAFRREQPGRNHRASPRR